MRVGISPKDFAAAIGVSESSVKRWVDQGALDAARTAGGHRRIKREEALRFVRERGVTVVRPDKLGLAHSALGVMSDGSLERAAIALFDELAAGHDAEASGILVALHLRMHPVAQIADEVIRPAMERIGELWRAGLHGVFVEHRATWACLSALDDLRELLPSADHDGRRVAVTASPVNDPYLLPAALVAIALVETGWRAVPLGADSPLAMIAIAAAELDARLLALSITSQPTDAFARELERFVASQHALGRTVAVGGQSVDRLALTPRPGLFVGHTLAELVVAARALAEAA